MEEFSSLRLDPEPNPQQWPPNRERPSVDCLRMMFSDLFKDAERLREDCILLANRVQRHKCDKNYCLKAVPNITELTICMFNFPLPLDGFEAVQHGVQIISVLNKMLELAHQGARFTMKDLRVMRNHPRVVETITEIMQGWRGNTNVRIIESLQLNYMLKATTGSTSFEKTVKDIVAEQSLESKLATTENYTDIYCGREKRKEFLDLVQRYEKNWSQDARTYVPHISPVFR